MKSITKFLEKKLGLTINQEKSEVRAITKTTFLGFNLQNLMGKWDADLAGRLNNDLRTSLEN